MIWQVVKPMVFVQHEHQRRSLQLLTIHSMINFTATCVMGQTETEASCTNLHSGEVGRLFRSQPEERINIFINYELSSSEIHPYVLTGREELDDF